MNKRLIKCLVLVVALGMKELRGEESNTDTTHPDEDGLSLHSSTLNNHSTDDDIRADDIKAYKQNNNAINDAREEHSGTTETPHEKDYPSFDDAKTLHSNLMGGYIKYIRPVKNQTKSVIVYISLSIYSLQDFDELLERISVGGVFFLIWRDVNMEWNESRYGGVKNIFVGYKDIWIPEIILSNPSDKLHSYGQDWQLVRFDSKGWASWAPGDIITAKCHLNHRYFPFDTQTCSLDLHVWGYLATEVKLIPVTDTIDTSILAEGSSWKVVKTTAVAWGDDWTSSVTFTIILARKPQYVIINAILPILFLCLLNVLVFLLPAESGERMSFAITALLSIAVFMTIVSNTIPKSSDPLPLIAYFLMTDLIISSLVSVCTVWNLRLFHKSDEDPVPQWLIKVYGYSCRICKWNITGNHKQGTSEITASNATNNNKRTSVKDTETGAVLGLIQTKYDVEMLAFHGPAKSTTAIGWQDISRMFDIIFLLFFASFSIVSFVTFFIVTNMQ